MICITSFVFLFRLENKIKSSHYSTYRFRQETVDGSEIDRHMVQCRIKHPMPVIQLDELISGPLKIRGP